MIMQTMKVLYIYGYGSSTDSSTCKWLKENLPNSEVCSFEYDQMNPYKSMDYLLKIVFDLNINIVFGSSLGGWYALNVAAIANIPCVVINPVTPEKMKDVIDLVSNENDSSEYLLKYIKNNTLFETKDDWKGYLWDKDEDGRYALLIWSDSDEVIRYGKRIPSCLSENFENICVVRDGKHQLTDKQKKRILLPAYKNFIENILPKLDNFYKKTFITP